MRKKIWSIASAILMFMLLANSCRQEHMISEIHSEKERAGKFQIFARTHGLQQYAAKGAADMHYQEGIRYLYYKYFELHPEDAPDFTNHEIPHVDFRYATQVFYEEDSSKVVFFPIVRNGKVIELLGAHLNPEDTYLTFVFHEEDEFRANALEEFASHKIDDPDTYGGIGHPIEGVVITVIKPLTNADFPKGLVDYTMPGSGNCAFYGDCGGGSGSVMPPLFNVQNPCIKTKALLAKTEVTDKIQDLKDHAANGTGEKGYKFMKDGTPPQQTTNNGPHSVNYGIPSLLNGVYHNHTGKTVDIFSASDISTLIEIARYQGVGSFGNAFHGMVAPNGIHYVIHFTGTLATDLPSGHYNISQLQIWDHWQTELKNYFINNPDYYSIMNGKKVLNSKGLETIFFETLKYMELQNKIELQKIDANNNVSTIKQNPDGTIANPIPCP